MEYKKKPFFFKFPNLKKPAKKNGDKPGKKLAYRRSLSFPDLRIVVDPSAADAGPAPAGDDVSSGSSPPQNNTDSIVGGNIQSERPLQDRVTNDLHPGVIRHHLPRDNVDNRLSAPMESWSLFEDTEYQSRPHLGSVGKWSLSSEPSFASVQKPARYTRANMMSALSHLALPVQAPRTVSAGQLTRPTAPGERDIWDRSETSSPSRSMVSEGVAGALSRASSFGDQVKGVLPEADRSRPPSVRSTPSQGAREKVERWALPQDGFWDRDRLTNTDSEEQDREMMSQFYIQLEKNQEEEEREEEEEEVEEEPGVDPGVDPLEAGQSAAIPSPFQIQRYLLNINLKEGKNLAIKNKRAAKSDPYVKFKLEGKQFYKSKVAYKNLNPRWNECFSHPLRDRDHVIEVRVYDKNRTSDEFMGSTSFTINNLDLYKNYEVELRLEDPKSKEENLGSIIVDLCLMYRDATIKRSPRF
ncbi:hypothetical protein CRUP_008247 [Coryphaenoides rupestris]|nr:hypothetical protein CRUP_008247 [Coryphaenoides rupestris]